MRARDAARRRARARPPSDVLQFLVSAPAPRLPCAISRNNTRARIYVRSVYAGNVLANRKVSKSSRLRVIIIEEAILSEEMTVRPR